MSDFDPFLPLLRFVEGLGAVDASVGWELLTGLDRDHSMGAGWLEAFSIANRGGPAALVAELLSAGGAACATWEMADDDVWVAATLCAGPGVARGTCTMALEVQHGYEPAAAP